MIVTSTKFTEGKKIKSYFFISTIKKLEEKNGYYVCRIRFCCFIIYMMYNEAWQFMILTSRYTPIPWNFCCLNCHFTLKKIIGRWIAKRNIVKSYFTHYSVEKNFLHGRKMHKVYGSRWMRKVRFYERFLKWFFFTVCVKL